MDRHTIINRAKPQQEWARDTDTHEEVLIAIREQHSRALVLCIHRYFRSHVPKSQTMRSIIEVIS